ncbi:MAG: tripartite tricarboxylate transporter TctB family protein [Candidatus Doudnabacteria bacterium]|nr:tripartite tricarboxylate transporter TctB family protein [Candidatus Doudnabacteria bacterium]
MNKQRRLNRERRIFLRHGGRWVTVAVGAAVASACSQSSIPTQPTNIPPTNNPPPATSPQYSGVATRDMSLLQVLTEAGWNTTHIYESRLGGRRFDGLDDGKLSDGRATSMWYIYVNDVRYADGTSADPRIDMTTVKLNNGTRWRVEKITALGFIVASVLFFLGWFFERRNSVRATKPEHRTKSKRLRRLVPQLSGG